MVRKFKPELIKRMMLKIIPNWYNIHLIFAVNQSYRWENKIGIQTKCLIKINFHATGYPAIEATIAPSQIPQLFPSWIQAKPAYPQAAPQLFLIFHPFVEWKPTRRTAWSI